MESRISLNKIVYLYLALPVIVFMLTWIRPSIGIPAALLVGFAAYLATKKADICSMKLSRCTIIITIAIAFAWCFFAGQGGFWYQSDDHIYRNAIFRDLVNYSWPVVYGEHDVLMNYYIGYWLVPALFGKFALFIFHNAVVAWLIAKIALLLWSTISITLCFLLLVNILQVKYKRQFYIAILFFILFSGLDIVGIYLTNGTAGLHLEWWAKRYQYSSFTTCLFWVFNQAVPAWIATLLLLYDRRVENFAFCGLCIFISSPIPLIGLLPIYVVIGVQELIKSKEKIAFVRKIFSLQNMIACLIIFPICLVYYSNNSAVRKDIPVVNKAITMEKSDNTEVQSSAVQPAPEKKTLSKILIKKAKTAVRFGTFYMLEAGIYLVLLLKKHKKSLLFWCLVFELLTIPFIHIGRAVDFAMRASIPPLVVLMTMVFDDFYQNYEKKSYKFILYCVILAFAILTPGKEFYRGAFEIYKNKKFENNTLLSIEKMIKPDKRWNNFIAYDYSQTLFYKYLAKK